MRNTTAKKMSDHLMVAGPNLFFGSRRNGSEGFAKLCFARTSGQSRMQAAWQMNGNLDHGADSRAWKCISNFSRSKKCPATWWLPDKPLSEEKLPKIAL